MDLTPLEHAAIAVILTAIGWACGDIYAGAFFAIGIMGGREFAQNEQKIVQNFYGNRRSNAPWTICIDVTKGWDVASVLDLVVPAVTVGIMLMLYQFILHGGH